MENPNWQNVDLTTGTVRLWLVWDVASKSVIEDVA